MSNPEFIKLTDEQVQARKRRNVAIALGLVGFIILVFIVTVTNLQRNSEAARRSAEAVAAAEARDAAATVEAASPTQVPAAVEIQQ